MTLRQLRNSHELALNRIRTMTAWRPTARPVTQPSNTELTYVT